MFLFALLFLVPVYSSNSSNQTNNSSDNSTCGSCKDTNEISYGIFAFLFAVFVIFLLIGIFFFVERIICKRRKKIIDCFKYLIKSTRYLRNKRRIRPINRRKKEISQDSHVIFNKNCVNLIFLQLFLAHPTHPDRKTLYA